MPMLRNMALWERMEVNKTEALVYEVQQKLIKAFLKNTLKFLQTWILLTWPSFLKQVFAKHTPTQHRTANFEKNDSLGKEDRNGTL